MPSFTLLAQSVLSGIFIGALYGLLGLGLSLSWGMLRQINLAHFALAFLGAYLTHHLTSVAHWDPLATLLVAAAQPSAHRTTARPADHFGNLLPDPDHRCIPGRLHGPVPRVRQCQLPGKCRRRRVGNAMCRCVNLRVDRA